MLIVNRIEDGIAVIEEENSRFDVPVSMLGENVREGDVVIFTDGKYVTDKNASDKIRSEIIKLQNGLWE